MIETTGFIAMALGVVAFGMFAWAVASIGNIAKNLRSIQRMMEEKREEKTPPEK
jgi:hypothetical protein